MLTIDNGHVYFNKATPNEVHAMRGLNVAIEQGQFVTVVGSNGAGKSTFANCIAGSVTLTSGSVQLARRDVTRMPDFRRARFVGRVFADPLAGTVADMTIEDNMAIAMTRGRRRSLRPSSSHKRREAMRELLAPLGLGLEDRLKEEVGRLSSGQRQSLTMAMAMAAAPQVLLLDEHLSALDPNTRDRLKELTVQFAKTAGCTSIMITHSMSDAIRLGDRLLVLNAGTLVGDYSGNAKAGLTQQALMEDMARAGGRFSDRELLSGIEN